jgi:hypothetical protein
METKQRVSVKCSYCKARWIETVTFSERGRAHHCERFDLRRALEGVTVQTPRGSIYRDWRWVAEHLSYEPVKWVAKATQTKCGAKCLGAHGPACDCECGGANHGIAG